jgi:hypothetical protein
MGPQGPTGPTGPQGATGPVSFPDAPNDGGTYGRKNNAWTGVGAGSTTPVFVSDTPPAGVPDGSLWWETDSGALYIRYNDGNSVQWVIATPWPDMTVMAPLASPQFSGNPTAPTPSPGDADTSLATTGFVAAAINSALFMRGYISGLILSTPGSSANFTVAAGAAGASDGTVMQLAAPLTKTNGAFVAGAGGGAMDTGSAAVSTWYHVHLIKRMDTGAVDVIFSLSPTAPTMPPNYTKRRRIGSLFTGSGGAWTPFTQDGDFFYWQTIPQDVSAATSTATLRTLSVPLGINVIAMLNLYLQFAGNGVVYVEHWDPTTALPNGWNGIIRIDFGLTGTISATNQIRVRTDKASRIYNLSSGSIVQYAVYTEGWIDTRDKDA